MAGFYISPNYTSDYLEPKNSVNIDKKIDIFEDRIKGWQLGIANSMINGGLGEMRHSGYAVLSVFLSFFENIAKYYKGFIPKNGVERSISRQYFKKGIHLIYPDFYPVFNQDNINDTGDKFYDLVRNGIYHTGVTKVKVLISGGFSPSIRMEGEYIYMNPHSLTSEILNWFDNYVEKLRDSRNTSLRENFEKRFDFDNGF